MLGVDLVGQPRSCAHDATRDQRAKEDDRCRPPQGGRVLRQVDRQRDESEQGGQEHEEPDEPDHLGPDGVCADCPVQGKQAVDDDRVSDQEGV